MASKRTTPDSGPEEDDLMREIDFLILAAEQSGDSRDSIRLILTTIRDMNGRLRLLSREVGGMRNDLHEQSSAVAALPSVDKRLLNLENKIGDGSVVDLVKQVQKDWRQTKLFMVGLFAAGAVFCILVVVLVMLFQFYLLAGQLPA